MRKVLDVYLNENLVGELEQLITGKLCFTYLSTWLENPNTVALSFSLPLRREPFSEKECRSFFAGILPEDSTRKTIARNLGINAKNDFAMLEKIGGECAGAITFLSKNTTLKSQDHSYRPISNSELAKILQDLPYHPLMAGEKEIRLSLAGVQDKIAVYFKNGEMALSLNSAPSTHIIKPTNPRFEGIVSNEELCLKLANEVGISSAMASINSASGLEYLLVERYDRTFDDKGKILRLHQEDFCQALGVSPDIKYQAEGGPSLTQCFELIRRTSTTPALDLMMLLDAVFYNFIIGNHDAHGKNFSLLYIENGIKLAPLYDLVCTTIYPELDKKMAMKIGGEYQSGKIQIRHFEKLAEDANLAKPLVKSRLKDMNEKVINAINNYNAENEFQIKLLTHIRKRCESAIFVGRS
jgi:serine/threonine-protein kinase HipA